jgi:hypothetical protein
LFLSREEEPMTFMPGKSGNPLGRTPRIDPRSEDLQVFCKLHQQDIRKVGEIALRRAIEKEEPWAIKLCMEYFYPKPGTYVSVNKEQTTEVNVNLSSFTQALSFEDKKTFLDLWMKSKRGTPAFPSTIDGVIESDCVEGEEEVFKGSKEDELVV